MASVYNSQLVRFFTSVHRLHSVDFGFEDAFELYHKIQENDAGSNSTEGGVGLPALGHALAGSAGTAISHLILYPLDLAITRLQVQKQLRQPHEAESAAEEADIEYKSIQDAVQKIYRSEGGLKAFYAGCFTDTSKSIVDAFLFFLAYTFLRQRRQQTRGTRNLPVMEEISVGMAAGAFSKFITTPIQQIVTRKQTAAMVAARDPTSSGPKDLNLREIALQIQKERGIAGFWAGYSASLILTLNPSLTMLFHNVLKRTMIPASRRDDPGPRLTFLLAALSKAAASTVMYPFSLAKTRAQIAASSPSPPIEKQDDITLEGLDKSEKDSQNMRKAKDQSRGLLRFISLYIRQPAVMKSLGQIYRNEGFLALYSGLEGEVLKGFLGHGLTMLLKERIHVGIVKLYFYTLKLLKKWPEELGSIGDHASKEMAKVTRVVGDAATDAKEKVGNVAETVKEGAIHAVSNTDTGSVSETAKGAVSNVSGRVGNVASTVKEGAMSAISGGKDTSNVVGTVKGAADSASERAGNIAETVKQGAVNAASSTDMGSVRGTAESVANDVKERAENIAVTVKEGASNVVSGKKDE
ncbi:hypothetical protein MBLNU457_1382t1 [Dothideomycetes sp. NU457]